MDKEELKNQAVEEAFKRLDYLLPNAKQEIIALIEENLVEGPKKLTTAYRKKKPQLSVDEKRNLGLRANAFLSTEAASQLTEKGRQRPLVAHEVTLRRAQFTYKRLKTVHERQFAQVVLQGHFHFDCAICEAQKGSIVDLDRAPIYEFPGCQRDVCGLGYLPVISSAR